MKRAYIVLFTFSLLTQLNGQSRTLISYDLETGLIEKLPDVFIPNLTKDQSSFKLGGFNNSIASLPLILDQNNLFEQSQWTVKAPAENGFDLNHFPIRTSIKLFGVEGDSLVHNCSGSMVGPRHVLTAAHCIAWFNLDFVYENIFACPVFDSGEYSSSFECSFVKKIYVFENWDFWGEDFAILELKESIGSKTGWISIGYDNELEMDSSLLHKFSYPVINGPLNNYNGDTLYYSHGYPDLFDELNIGFSGANGAGGESGSSIIKVINEEAYTSYGVFTWIDDSKHSRMQPEYFYPFLEVITQELPSTLSKQLENNAFEVYPNPTRTHLYFKLNEEFDESLSACIYDFNGRLLHKTITSSNEPMDISFLEQGYYMIRISAKRVDNVFRFVKID